MAFVAAVLLMQMDEETAFWALSSMMENRKYLDGYYSQDLARVQHDAEIFTRVLAEYSPKLARQFDQLGIHPLMYVTPWFMCVFTSLPCWDTVLNIWDVMMIHGVKTIIRVGLAIMAECQVGDSTCFARIFILQGITNHTHP